MEKIKDARAKLLFNKETFSEADENSDKYVSSSELESFVARDANVMRIEQTLWKSFYASQSAKK